MMPEIDNHKIERKITLSYLAQWFETLWAALLWPLLVIAFSLALLFSGLLITLNPWAKAAILLVLAGLFLWSCRSFFTARWPSRQQTLRQLEDYAALKNRPLSARDDQPAADALPESEQSLSQQLWQAHQQQQRQQLNQLKVKPPRSRWAALDQKALRVPATLLLLASLLLVPTAKMATLKQSLFFAVPTPAPQIQQLDAWLKPPTYTGKPPVLLTSPAQIVAQKIDPVIAAPKGSMLSIRFNNAYDPSLVFAVDETSAEQPLALESSKNSDGHFEAEAPLKDSGLVRLYDDKKLIASWHFKLVPDQPPSITIVETPKADKKGALVIKWRGQDDYGLTMVKPVFTLSDEQEDGVGFTSTGVFLFDPPQFAIAVKSGSTDQTGSATSDQTAHPWAGLNVNLTLEATDTMGQTTASPPVTFKLPARLFITALGQALIEQRKSLIMEPDDADQTADLLAALLRYPKKIIARSGIQLSLATIAARLHNQKERSDIDQAIDGLWQIALQVDTGRDPSAVEELEKASAALAEALRRGDPPERVQELMKRYRMAMQNYLKAMKPDGNQPDSSEMAEGKSISPDELQAMMDKIEELNKQGKTAEAQELLSQLNEILKNLRMGTGQGSGGSNPGPGVMKELGEMLKKQQQLMDQSQRQQSGQTESPDGTPRDGTPRDGTPGSGPSAEQSDKLAEEQQKLQQQLRKFQNKLGEFGLSPPANLGDAGKNMGDAADALGNGMAGDALDEQGEAMKNLRESAKKLSQQLGQQKSPNGASGNQSDPLGRDKDGNGRNSDGRDLGDLRNQEMRRASEILKELRDRLGLPSLESNDRSYIERLLDGLN